MTKALRRYPRQLGIMVMLMVSLLSLGDLASALGAPGLAQHRQHANALDGAADLAITNISNVTSVTVGRPLTYTLLVTNMGPATATSVVANTALPATATLGAAVATQGTCSSSLVVTCSLDSIAAGNAVTITINVTLSQVGAVSSSASVASAEIDPNPANNTAHASTTSDRVLVYLPVALTPPPPPSVLSSIADVDVIQGFPTSNFGNSGTMWVGYHRAGCAQASVSRGISRGLVRFDVSTIPAGSVITQAVLHVDLVGACWRTSRTGETRAVSAYRVAGDWTETVTSWSTQPALAEPYGSTAIPLTNQVLNWYTLDVTNLVRGWANGSVPNYGLALRSVESAGDEFVWLSFATREWSGSAPYLTLTYAGAQQAQEVLAAEATPPAATCAANAQELVICEHVGGATETK